MVAAYFSRKYNTPNYAGASHGVSLGHEIPEITYTEDPESGEGARLTNSTQSDFPYSTLTSSTIFQK